ncbi:phosphate/phosphite/phosphonate ABC transporter substrate-binding protein [Flagellimonas sp.]|uniref:phosphate/phosphite/phosphonate ABC transporter substrate-binding protein n=1 Tax=Flagellimonas sp. TaxID=2058762 RepID=UPI003F49B64D
MKKRFHFLSMAICLPFVLMFLLFGCSGKTEKNSNTFVLATYTYSTNYRIANLKPLSLELGKLLVRPIEIKSYSDVPSFIQGIKSNEVDMALINTLGYLSLSLDNQHMEPVATLKIREEAVDNYKTVLLGNPSRANHLDVIQKNPEKFQITFVAPGSTSGNLVPRLFLSSNGIDSPEKQFQKTDYAGTHQAAIVKLLSGETDICALGSNEYFKQLKKDSTLSQSSSLLWMSSEIPLGPVLLNKRMENIEKEKVTRFLSTLHETHPEILEALKDGWSEAKQAEKFVPITDMYYDEFRRINGNSSNLYQILDFFMSNPLR